MSALLYYSSGVEVVVLPNAFVSRVMSYTLQLQSAVVAACATSLSFIYTHVLPAPIASVLLCYYKHCTLTD